MSATPESVWEYLQEVGRRIDKLGEEIKELKESIVELRELSKKNDKEIEELRELFRESDKSTAKLRELFRESDKEIKELRELFKEGDKEIKELRELFKETDKKFKETDKRFKETDRRLDKRFRETDKKIKELSNLFTTQWGKLVEALVEPGAVNLFRERGIDVYYTARRIEVEDEKRRKIAEYDIVLVNDKEVVVIEVKTTVKKEDVDYFLEKLAKVREHLRSLVKDKKVYGAIAGINFEEGVDRYAYRSGLFVLKSEGGIIRIANDPEFKPKIW
jgi:hypothetical protein